MSIRFSLLADPLPDPATTPDSEPDADPVLEPDREPNPGPWTWRMVKFRRYREGHRAGA